MRGQPRLIKISSVAPEPVETQIYAPVAQLWLGSMSRSGWSDRRAAVTLGRIVEELPPMRIKDSRVNQRPLGHREQQMVMEFAPADWGDLFEKECQVEYAGRSYGWPRPACVSDLDSSWHSGRWWTIPTFRGSDTIRTRTTHGPYLDAPCVAAYGVEDTTFESPWLGEVAADRSADSTAMWRPFRVSPGARVFEIGTQEDWSILVQRYPLELGGPTQWRRWFGEERFVAVDWCAAAADLDGVHVSQMGYLWCAYAPIRTSLGISTLAGWGPDQTLWLRASI